MALCCGGLTELVLCRSVSDIGWEITCKREFVTFSKKDIISKTAFWFYIYRKISGCVYVGECGIRSVSYMYVPNVGKAIHLYSCYFFLRIIRCIWGKAKSADNLEAKFSKGCLYNRKKLIKYDFQKPEKL